MNPMSRRILLRSGCGTAVFAFTGCLGDGRTRSGEENDESEDGADHGENDYAIVQYSSDLAAPEWREHDERGYLSVLITENEVRDSLRFDDLPEDHREEIEQFVAETDFEETVLLYVGSVGPSTCHDALEVRDLDLEERTLVGEIGVIDVSGGDTGCGGAETHPSALIRPEFDVRPERIELTIIDGWDERETIERTVE